MKTDLLEKQNKILKGLLLATIETLPKHSTGCGALHDNPTYSDYYLCNCNMKEIKKLLGNFVNNMENWLEESKKKPPLWERMLDKIPVIRRLRWIRWYYRDAKYAVKKRWQLKTRGYADVECWNLAYSTSEWILPRLKHFRNNFYSVPPNLEAGCKGIGHCVTPEDVEKQTPEERFSLTVEEWRCKLDKMIYAFEFILTEDGIVAKCYPADYNWGFTSKPCEKQSDCREIVWNDSRKPDYTYYNECKQKYEEGMKLFSLYFQHLWD